jgi:Ca2+-binding EF-hand superfamily protein
MLVTTLVVGAALAWSSRAQTGAPPADDKRPREVAQMRLSSAQVQQAFQHIDSNRDGALSRVEIRVFPRIERHFERIDANRDGTISPAEFETALQQAS